MPKLLPEAEWMRPSKATTLAADAGASADSLAFVRAFFAARRATWIIVGVALLLTSSALTLGFTGDDYFHKQMQEEHPGIEGLHRAELNLFTFASGDPHELKGLMNEGICPWWVSPNLRFVFFRPLSSLTHRLDHALWPSHPLPMHVHSMLWFALLLLVVGAVLRRFSGSPWLAGFALFLFAVDDARAAPVGWISNRNALIATLFALLALCAHDRARKHGDRRAALYAPLWFALGLAGGEAAVQVGGYFVAYALFLDPAPKRARFLSLLPYGLVVVLWRIVYFLGEYGVRGSGLYLDPIGDPAGFWRAALVRLPILWLGQFGLPWSEFWDLFPVIAPSLQTAQLVLAVLVLAATVLLLRPLYRRDPLVRFWLLGTLLATLPACAAIPNDRLLTATGVGGSWLIARYLAEVAEHTYPNERWFTRAAAAALIAVHALFSPLALPLRTKAIDGLEVLMRRADQSIPSDASIADRHVVLLNPPADPFPMYFAGFRQAQGIPRPRYLRWLAIGVSELRVQRVDAQTLRLRPTAGYLSNSSQWTLRDRRLKSHVGETIELADATFVVDSVTTDGRPLDVRVRFHERLESPRYLFMQWGRHEYVPFALPAIGDSVTLPAVDMRSALLGLGLTD